MGKANKQSLLIDLTSGYPELTKTQTQTDTHTPWGPSLVMSDCRAQDDSSMKTFPPTSSIIGCDSGYIKMIFFPILFMSPAPFTPHPHPLLKLAPKAQKRNEGEAR